MSKERDQIIQYLKSFFLPLEGVELCILYGSAASDRMNDQSDLDIAVGSRILIDRDRLSQFSTELTLKFDREVTVFDLSRMEGLILSEVLTKGITIKCSDSIFLSEQIIRMQSYTEDVMPYQMMGIKNKIERFLNE